MLLFLVLFHTSNASSGMFSALMPQMNPMVSQFPYMAYGVEGFSECQDQDLCKASFNRAMATNLYQKQASQQLPKPAQQVIQTAVKQAPKALISPADDCYIFAPKELCNGHILDKGCLWDDSHHSCGKAPALAPCSAFPTAPQCVASKCKWVPNTTATTAAGTSTGTCSDPTILVNIPHIQPAPAQPTTPSIPMSAYGGLAGAAMNGLNFAAEFESEEYLENLGMKNLLLRNRRRRYQNTPQTSPANTPIYYIHKPRQQFYLQNTRPIRPIYRNRYSTKLLSKYYNN